jgi:hypothetical protein
MTPQQKNGGVTAIPLDTMVIEPEQLVITLRALRERIPEYVQMDIAEMRSIASVASVDKALIDSVIKASDESEIVQQAIGMTPVEMRSEAADVIRWDEAEKEVRLLLQGMSSANRIRKHRLGLAALQAYNISRQLVRKKIHANLLPHVRDMRALIKAGRKPAVKPDTTIAVKQ